MARLETSEACTDALGELNASATTFGPEGTARELQALSQMVRLGPVCVLTGAGLSTESGIPDYRGPGTRRRARNPMQYRELLHSEEARKRYWARSMLGWPQLSAARPNPGHYALTALEEAGLLNGVITQNVDGLHLQAGTRQLIELHGALRDVVCMCCGWQTSRAWLQERLVESNRELAQQPAELLPDGDAELPEAWVQRFTPVACNECGGALRPSVVFFGETVPRPQVDRAFQMVERAASLLVIGSSLAVYSGLRFVRRARDKRLPIAIVCLGPTRGDQLAHLRIQQQASTTLMHLAELLGATPRLPDSHERMHASQAPSHAQHALTL